MNDISDAADRDRIIDVVPPQPRARSRQLFDLLAERRVLQPAHRAAPPDRLLRRPPAGVQLQHAREEGARRREHRRAPRDAVRARDRSRRVDRRHDGRTSPAGVRGWPRRDEVRAVRRRKPIGGCSTRCSARISSGRDIRCSIAREAVFAILEHEAMHQETLLYMWHRLPFEQKQRAGRLRAARATDRAAGRRMDRRSGRARDARRRPRGDSVRVGQRVPAPARPTCRRSPSSGTTSPTRGFSSSSRPAAIAIERWWRREDWRWMQRERVSHPLFWERERRRAGSGAACSS